MLKTLKRIFGSSSQKEIRKYNKLLKQINDLESRFVDCNKELFSEETLRFKERFQDGATLDDLLPEAFALVREAAKQAIGLRHFDAQIIGGIVLHQGNIAEMRTGEGKTLVATLPAYLNSLTGDSVHIVTVNDYLARRDPQWMGPVYDLLGMSVGILQNNSAYIFQNEAKENNKGFEFIRSVERKEAYQCDIVYGTNSEFGFDYLRDNMVVNLDDRVQGELSYAVIDEVDNILIDEARTPLIISGPSEDTGSEYKRYSRLVKGLINGEDFQIDDKHQSVSLSLEGVRKVENLMGVDNLYDPDNSKGVHFVENALRATAVFEKDKKYVVKDGQIVIVDEFTGRLMPGRRYSDGLHQALEAKENLNIQRETITYATITLQNFFRMYSKLSGMTGTAVTESEEFWKIYKLDVIEIPTNLPMIREDHNDFIFKSQKIKYDAVVKEVIDCQKKGQPVLIGTTEIAQSELVSKLLTNKKISHQVLNAKEVEKEAGIIAQAGRPGAVTVATNMAGRGTDIILGGNPDDLKITSQEWNRLHQQVIQAGGLHIIGTQRHEARRIDNQLRGRAGRQGDPGSSRFFVALDDDLMKRFGGDKIKAVMDWVGMEEDAPIEHGTIGKQIERAQIRVEGFHFDLRKHLVEYDDVINTHREVIYKEKNSLLEGENFKSNVLVMVDEEVRNIVGRYDLSKNSDIPETLKSEIHSIIPFNDFEEIEKRGDESFADRLIGKIMEYFEFQYNNLEGIITDDTLRSIERQLILRIVDTQWVQHLTSMENLRTGIGLQAYGQRDPLVMYKREGHSMFQSLMDRIRYQVTRTVFYIADGSKNQISPENSFNKRKTSSQGQKYYNNGNNDKDTKVLSAVGSNNRKLGRNEPCYCNSGKKYKKCHGAL
ncbi:MAG: preprotein translocase subunit SecA [Chloroflexi bacterium]|nr:preprotein translocase subunit SecA [Chloroflexota bacterium]MQG05964.1 preprotein translocase subunit SecA [SAR202 cluster bacterium]|tara:strand:+ start:1140 stop:3788 length:2649 start_codon:yes stop_codon:yes gene_type:complete